MEVAEQVKMAQPFPQHFLNVGHEKTGPPHDAARDFIWLFSLL
jgi:hypothetical protein